MLQVCLKLKTSLFDLWHALVIKRPMPSDPFRAVNIKINLYAFVSEIKMRPDINLELPQVVRFDGRGNLCINNVFLLFHAAKNYVCLFSCF